jgi:outer membrane beta-barrel protein
MKRLLLVLATLIFAFEFQIHAAETVDIPEEELAKESVLPKFDRPDSVKNRNVVMDKKIEFGAYYGANFSEPIYNQSKLGVNIGYHWSEEDAVMFNLAMWMSGRNSQYVPSIEEKGNTYDFSQTPNLQYSVWANYERNAYYGKISLTKQGVMNLSLYPIAGLGMTKFEHKMYPGLNGGIGQKFYFNKSLALRIDFKIQYQQTVNPFLGNNRLKVGQHPDPGEFSDKWDIGTVLDVGMSYLF